MVVPRDGGVDAAFIAGIHVVDGVECRLASQSSALLAHAVFLVISSHDWSLRVAGVNREIEVL